jgi:predicted metal-binding protein
MKKLLLVLLAMIFCGGCNGLIVNVFNAETGKLEERIILTSTMITQDINSITVETPNAKVVVDKLSQIYDSKAWVDMGRGWAIATTGGIPEMAERWLTGQNIVDVNEK